MALKCDKSGGAGPDPPAAGLLGALRQFRAGSPYPSVDCLAMGQDAGLVPKIEEVLTGWRTAQTPEESERDDVTRDAVVISRRPTRHQPELPVPAVARFADGLRAFASSLEQALIDCPNQWSTSTTVHKLAFRRAGSIGMPLDTGVVPSEAINGNAGYMALLQRLEEVIERNCLSVSGY